jgi:hypothetical protein
VTRACRLKLKYVSARLEHSIPALVEKAPPKGKASDLKDPSLPELGSFLWGSRSAGGRIK